MNLLVGINKTDFDLLTKHLNLKSLWHNISFMFVMLNFEPFIVVHFCLIKYRTIERVDIYIKYIQIYTDMRLIGYHNNWATAIIITS